MMDVIVPLLNYLFATHRVVAQSGGFQCEWNGIQCYVVTWVASSGSGWPMW